MKTNLLLILIGGSIIATISGDRPVQAASCKDFATQESAQAYMVRTGDQKLDGDGDGIACERLPRQSVVKSPPKAAIDKPLRTKTAIATANRMQSGYKVISVGDGDTLRVRQPDGTALTVRLACVDAPELAQKPYGEQSRARLQQLLPVGQALSLRIATVDRYGRSVAEIYQGATNINLQMVKEGQAVVYRQYLSACPSSQQQLLQAELVAKRDQLGFWQQNNPILPAVFRQQ
jgi:endonuclease YncB( thermonuclease family)